MYKACILILIYNKEIEDSATVSKILESNLNLEGFKFVLWNNGPKYIDERSADVFDKVGYKAELIQTVENLSLSKIYNSLYSKYDSERYVVLDDDSYVTSSYLKSILLSPIDVVGIPVISCRGANTSPLIDRKPISCDQEIGINTPLFAIGSGMVIGRKAVEVLLTEYGNLFDDRFYFYGVDVTFCHRINSLLGRIEYKILPGFEHNQSKLMVETDSVKKFRRKERSYDLGLRLRYYSQLPKSTLVLLRVLGVVLMRKLLYRDVRYNFLDLFIAFFSGRHYKNRISK